MIREPAATHLRLLLVSLFWGGIFVSGKLAVSEVGPFTVAEVRFLLSALTLLILLAHRRPEELRAFHTRHVPLFLGLGLVGIAAYNALFYFGLKLTSASQAALMMPTNLPVATALMASLILKEPFDWRKALGIGLSLAGVVLVVGQGGVPRLRPSDLVLLTGVLCFAVFSVYGKVATQVFSPLAANAFLSVFGAAFLLPLAFTESPWASLEHAPLGFWLNIGYTVVFGTVLSYVWWYEGIQRIGASRAGVFTYLVPVWAMLLSFMILGERVSLPQLAGGLMAASGIWVVNGGRGG